MAEILPNEDIQPEVLHDDRTGAPRSESYESYTKRYAEALGITPEELRENMHLYAVEPGVSSTGGHYSAATFAGRATDAKLREPSTAAGKKDSKKEAAPSYPYDAMWDRGDGSHPILVTVTGSYGSVKGPDDREFLQVKGQLGGVPIDRLQKLEILEGDPNAARRTELRDRGWAESKEQRDRTAAGPRYRSNPLHKHDVPYPAGSLEPEPKFVDKGWKQSKAIRQAAADADPGVQRVQGRRDELRHNLPYHMATHKLEATEDAKKKGYPIGAILTIENEAGETEELPATLLGYTGIMEDGRSWFRTREHGMVPAEQIKTLESEIGIDTTRFVLAGIGPALYWKKVRVIADEVGDSPGMFQKLFSKFIDSHPGLKTVGEAAASARDDFVEDHPRLGGILSGATSILRSAGSVLAARVESNSMYSFKEAQERDTQASRTFYMARPNHPITIWFKSRNYDGSLNQLRKDELMQQRADGLALQDEIAGRGTWSRVFRPNGLYRKELHEFLASTPGALGYRAVAFANIQRIANLQHRGLTHGQWAIQLMNGRALTERETADFRRYRRDRRLYKSEGVSPPPRTASTPRVSPHLVTNT